MRGVFDAYICGANTGQSPEVQAWYIYPLSIFANITASSDPSSSASLTAQYALILQGGSCARTDFNDLSG